MTISYMYIIHITARPHICVTEGHLTTKASSSSRVSSKRNQDREKRIHRKKLQFRPARGSPSHIQIDSHCHHSTKHKRQEHDTKLGHRTFGDSPEEITASSSQRLPPPHHQINRAVVDYLAAAVHLACARTSDHKRPSVAQGVK